MNPSMVNNAISENYVVGVPTRIPAITVHFQAYSSHSFFSFAS